MTAFLIGPGNLLTKFCLLKVKPEPTIIALGHPEEVILSDISLQIIAGKPGTWACEMSLFDYKNDRGFALNSLQISTLQVKKANEPSAYCHLTNAVPGVWHMSITSPPPKEIMMVIRGSDWKKECLVKDGKPKYWINGIEQEYE